MKLDLPEDQWFDIGLLIDIAVYSFRDGSFGRKGAEKDRKRFLAAFRRAKKSEAQSVRLRKPQSGTKT